MGDDIKKLEAPPKAPSTPGEEAKAEPNDDTFVTDEKQEALVEPDNIEAYGVKDVTKADVEFDNPVLQAVHTHPFWITLGILIGVAAVGGAIVTGIKYAKCGRL
jgi:hypothetical protein